MPDHINQILIIFSCNFFRFVWAVQETGIPVWPTYPGQWREVSGINRHLCFRPCM